MKKLALVLVALMLVALYTPTIRYIPGLMTHWSVTDTSLAVNLDTSAALTREYVIRLADSAAANRTGAFVPEDVHVIGTANFSNQATDSTNLALNGTVFNTLSLPYNLYADRVIIRTAKPGATLPQTFPGLRPPVTSDSALIFRISRYAAEPAGTKLRLTIYKVANNAGLSFNATVGTFYDMVIYDEAALPAAGTSSNVYVTIVMKKRR